MNRIHWKTTARHGEIQVKEFDLEQTADAWIVLDLQRGDPARPRRRVDHRGGRPGRGVVADKAIGENRAVGMTRQRRPAAVVPADRGGRQHQKIMQLLAAVEADGSDAARGDAGHHGRPAASRDDRGRS